MNRFRNFFQGELAQEMAEYAITLAVVGLGVSRAAVAVAIGVHSLWSVAAHVIAVVP
jgi:hypothetical protein